MERKKLVIATVTSILILLTIFAPILMVAKATDPSDWYTTEPGVLDSDYYLLYPYSPQSLKLGFSQYGELIDSNTNVGLEYGGARDPFAAPAGASIDTILPKKVWINGWYIDIRYVHSDWGNRHLWAGALFADKTDYGKNWTRVDNNYTYPSLPMYEYQETFDDKGKELNGFTPGGSLVNGGRKTNGTAITEPIEVLYDGPRRFVAKAVTHIYDWYEDLGDGEDANLHIVDVILTIIFNKVKKEVIVLKDVKIVDQAKFVIDPLTITVTDGREGEDDIVIERGLLIQFSNREEWDLGKKGVSGTADYSSYVHFYTAGTAGTYDTLSEGQETDYNEDWTMLPTLPANTTYNGVNVTAHGLEPSTSGTYDLAQIISNDVAYVGWHAFWPSLSDWSADAARSTTKTWYRAMTAADPHYIDTYTGTEPFLSPLVLGEWDFVLADNEYVKTGENTGINVTANVQFRGVSVYGVTDRHDANDPNKVIDSEVQYQLDEVFNPWDLNDAVEKQEYRWLYYDDSLAAATSYITLTEGLDDNIYNLTKSYSTFTAEWVNAFENGSTYTAHSKNWAALMQVNCTAHADQHADLRIVPPGAGTTLKFSDIVDLDFWYYLYASPSPTYGPHICVYLSKTGGRTSGERADITMMTNTNTTTGTWLHVTLPTIADYVQTGDGDKSFIIFYDSAVAADWGSATQGPGNPHSLNYWQGLNSSITEDYIVDYIQVELGWWANGVAKALIDDVSFGYLNRTSGIKYQRVYNMEEDKLIPSDWDAYCSFAERVLIDGTLIDRSGYHNATAHEPYYAINFETGNLTFSHWATGLDYHAWSLPIGTHIKVLYSTIEENEKGRYEWTIMGRDAFTSDSLGGALVTAAFKNKDIEIGLTGLDMMYYEWLMPSIPYVMNCFGTAPGARADYKDDGSTPGQRPALRDDWCTTWPITSSNMIAIGGPLANMFTSYLNEFTDAFYGTYVVGWGETYTSYATWQNKIVALTCWDGTNKGYGATYDTGYAVIATYKDLNGTVGLTIWGHGPRDTYYASKFFHEEIIYELQEFPRCVTSIILEIDYTDPLHPTFSIVECLGTISERLVETTKGGIHDP